MLQRVQQRLTRLPTPLAGLALAIASLGWCWENAADLHQYAKWGSALIAAVLLLVLTTKFLRFPHLLREDLSHPVVGSVLPTFAMGWMVVSNSVGQWHAALGQGIWLAAIALHLVFLGCFIHHRAKKFALYHMVPSWFVPPVGIVVADVAFPGGALQPLAHGLLYFGLMCYAIMLPIMIYRLVFERDIPDQAKPTIAIMAAPASLCLAGYLTVVSTPSPLLVALLASIAVLMTVMIYVAFFALLRLPFNPGYAAFTFPMVIGATAQYKLAAKLTQWGMAADSVQLVRYLAQAELWIATLVVGYVALRYLLHYFYTPHGHQQASCRAITTAPALTEHYR